MKRREFVGLLSAGATLASLAPGIATAASDCPQMAGGVYYTKDSPGRWAKKAGGHLPQLEIASSDEGRLVKVMTAHEMRAFEHYIVKHVMLDQNYRFIAEHLFDPRKDSVPVSQFKLGNYQGRLHVLSVCNKHDTWLNSIDA